MTDEDLAYRLTGLVNGTELPMTPFELVFLESYNSSIGNIKSITHVAKSRNLMGRLDEESCWSELGLVMGHITRQNRSQKIEEGLTNIMQSDQDDDGNLH